MSIVFFIVILVYLAFMILVINIVAKYSKRHKGLLTISVFLILLLIPTWDYFLGIKIFNKYCKNEAGLHIYQDIERVNSIYIENVPPYFFLDYGYEFVEGKENGSYFKYSFDKNSSKDCMKKPNRWHKDGKCIAKIKIEAPISFYKLTSSIYGKQISKPLHILQRNSPKLYEAKTGHKVAEIINYYWDGGWVLSMTGFGTKRCDYKLDNYDELISKTTSDFDIYESVAKSYEKSMTILKENK